MNNYFEICHTQIPLDKIIEYRVIEREYIYRPSYTTIAKNFHTKTKQYQFKQMVPYAAIYDEAEYKSAIKAFRAITGRDAVAKDISDGILTTLGDKLNIKVWKYNKYTCRNQAGRVFKTYLQDVPASVETAEGKRSEIYPNDELYGELGEPIAPSIEFIPALLILTKDELFTFYGNGIQVDAEVEYTRLKETIEQYQEVEKDNLEQKKALSSKPKFPILSPTIVQINLPQFTQKLKGTKAEVIDAEYDPLDLNHDGVVDEKDMELFKLLLENKDNEN